MELMEEIPEFREDDEYAMYLKDVGLENIQSIHGVRNLLYMLPQRSLIPEEHHGSTWVADRSVKYIKDNAGKRPFFLWSSWIAPHPPFDVPDSFADLYNDTDIPEAFKLGTGHELFFVNKPEYTLNRYNELYTECKKRGFNVTDWSDKWDIYKANDNSRCKLIKYPYNEHDNSLIHDRIKERLIGMKRIHYYSKTITAEEAIKILIL
jgi:hypothetical protein